MFFWWITKIPKSTADRRINYRMIQFTHMKGYALSASSKSKGKAFTVTDILAEVLREDGHCPHVENPEPPTIVLGDMEALKGLEARIRARVAEWNTSEKIAGRKALRKDAHVLHTHVASYPKDGGDYDDWERRNIEHFKSLYGDDLVAVIRHTDEENPHLHTYVINTEGSPDVKSRHPGFVAAKGIKNPKEQRIAYTQAMRSYQNRYYNEVGVFCGMARLGPRRRRLNRAEWQAEKVQAAAIKQGLSEVEKQQAELQARSQNLTAEVQKQAKALMRAQSIKKMKAATPDLPEPPASWQGWKLGDYVAQVDALIKAQAEQIALIPEMRETLAIYRAEGVRLKEEVAELRERVGALSHASRAWSLVEQIFPEVAKDVVGRLSKAPGTDGGGSGTGGIAPAPVDSVALSIPDALVSS